jgi:hypothetical protein
MNYDKGLLLSLLFVLTTVSIFLNISAFATTDESSDEGDTNQESSNSGDIVGTVQNISEPVS